MGLSTGPSRGPRAGELLAATIVFIALTVFATYPQVIQLSSGVGTHYDALFSIWRIAWIAHQLPRDPLQLFDANIFYPERNTLAYSDAMLLSGLLGAPVIWLGVSPIVVHNVLILMTFVTSGVAMYVLVRSLTNSRLAAFFSGIAFTFQAYRFAHYPQLELLWTAFIPLALWSWHRVLATQSVRDGLLLGLFTGLQAWACLYYAVFLTTALAIVSAVIVVGRRGKDVLALLKPAAAAVALCSVMTVPYALPYIDARKTVGARAEDEIRQWSPTVKAYAATTPENWLYGKITDGFGYLEGTMFPGVVPVALAIVALFGKWRREVTAYFLLLIVTFDLSLGLNGWLYSWLYALAWPYQGLRVPARLFVIVATALAVLSGYGVARSIALSRSMLVGGGIAVLAMSLALLEALCLPLPLDLVTRERTMADRWLAAQPRAPVFEWPIPSPDRLGITQDPHYMLRSTLHWQPLLNGYSGFHPPSYTEMLTRMSRFPAPESIRALQRAGVRYIVLHSRPDPVAYTAVQDQLVTNNDVRMILLERVSSGELALYELNPP